MEHALKPKVGSLVDMVSGVQQKSGAEMYELYSLTFASILSLPGF